MTKSEMIDALLNSRPGDPAHIASRRSKLSRMSAAALKREMLYRGIEVYDEPDTLEDDEYEFPLASVLENYSRANIVD